MDRKYNKSIVSNARELRNNMTKEEKHLWYDFLKSYPVPFSRQKVLGRYIADFYCYKAKLVIELDGSQHFEEKGIIYDEKRTEFLKEYGLTVIRVANSMVNQHFREVCEFIDAIVKSNCQ